MAAAGTPFVMMPTISSKLPVLKIETPRVVYRGAAASHTRSLPALCDCAFRR